MKYHMFDNDESSPLLSQDKPTMSSASTGLLQQCNFQSKTTVVDPTPYTGFYHDSSLQNDLKPIHYVRRTRILGIS